MGTPRTPSKTRRRAAWALAPAGLLIFAACSGSGSDGDAATSARRAPEVGAAEGAGGGSVAADADGASGPVRIDLADARRPAGRDVIYTARLEVGVDDVVDAAERATRAARAAGGYVFAEDRNLEGDPRTVLTLKVPPDAFDPLLDRLIDLGEVERRDVAADDVTGQVVDLEARLASARTSADRLRELLAETGSVGDLLAVERELAAREGQVESLAGQLAALQEQVDFATITLRLVGTAAADPEVSDDIPGFLAGLRTGAAALGNTALAVATALGFALPFVPVAALLAVPALVLVRRRRRAAA